MATKAISQTFDQLPTDLAKRREALLAVLGEHLLQSRNERLERVHQLLRDPSAIDSLGTINARPYRAVTALGEEAINAGEDLAKIAIDNYIVHLLSLLTHIGGDLAFGEKHAVRYRLVAEVIDRRTHELIEECVINRGMEKSLPDYFGRWLNRYGTVTKSAIDDDTVGAG